MTNHLLRCWAGTDRAVPAEWRHRQRLCDSQSWHGGLRSRLGGYRGFQQPGDDAGPLEAILRHGASVYLHHSGGTRTLSAKSCQFATDRSDVVAIGGCFMWPTMLVTVARRYPDSGPWGIGIVGFAGATTFFVFGLVWLHERRRRNKGLVRAT